MEINITYVHMHASKASKTVCLKLCCDSLCLCIGILMLPSQNGYLYLYYNLSNAYSGISMLQSNQIITDN